jgi:hypothetical protein
VGTNPFGVGLHATAGKLQANCKHAALLYANAFFNPSPDPHASICQIRELLASGAVDRVQHLMGRPYRLVAAIKFGLQPVEGGVPSSSVDSDGMNNAAGRVGNSSNSSSVWDSGVAGRLQPGVCTSSMDGTDSEAVPLQLRDGGAAAFVGIDGLLNAAPGPGRYTAALTLHLGAAPADELLHLEAVCAAGGGGNGGGSSTTGASSASASGASCMVLPEVELELRKSGLTLPAGPQLRALTGGLQGPGSGPGQALIVLDFKRRL